MVRAIRLDPELQLLDGRIDMGDCVSLVALEVVGRIAREHLFRVLQLIDCRMHDWKMTRSLPLEFAGRLRE